MIARNMAWLYKQPGSGNWYLGYRVNGKLKQKSTGTSDRAKAEAELQKVETMFNHARTGTLTEELYQALTGAQLPKITLASEIEDWLKESRQTTAANTFARYQTVSDDFKAFLNANDNGPLLSAITTADLDRYLLHKRASSAASTVNVSRKILAGFFKRAIGAGRLRDNPATAAKTYKAQKGEKVRRRTFTLEELQSIYKHAPNDFWRYMILGGTYTGLRLGDLVTLKWGNVDLSEGFITVEPDKTEDKLVTIPIAKPFLAMLASLKARAGKVKPSDYIWPEEAGKHARYKSKSGYFSNQFHDLILVKAGLVEKRSHRAKENSTGKRTVSEISFHCLRHTFISTLKSNGGSQTVAKALAGHSSDVVNDMYTHVPKADLIKAVNQLPEFVK